MSAVSERQATQVVSKPLWETAVEAMPLALCVFDSARNLLGANERFYKLYGLSQLNYPPGTPAQTVFDAIATLSALASEQSMQLSSAQRQQTTQTRDIRLADGRIIEIATSNSGDGTLTTLHQDVTLSRRAADEVQTLALMDVLTGLYNRMAFRRALEDALTFVARDEVAVILIDLDEFKAVNDTLGHPVGDALLVDVSKRLKACLRPQDIIARLGGDEFAVIQRGSSQPDTAVNVGKRIVEALSQPFTIQGHSVNIGASIGVAAAPFDSENADELIKFADLALYRAKDEGRNTLRCYEPAMDVRMRARRQLEIDLREAIEQKQFELHYQPLIDLRTGDPIAFEALIRWNHPDRRQVPPSEFIALAEECGLIVQIGEWVILEACKDAAQWPGNIAVSVNISPIQFKSRGLVHTVVSALSQSGLDASRLELEITESVLMNDTQQTLSILNQLKGFGVQIVMDDFGTGYSSLGYLRKFPFNKIKIDRSFIQNLGHSKDALAIVRAVQGLSSSLGMKTTVEGVETLEQLAIVTAEGCEEAQGYLISKPRPVADIKSVIEDITRNSVTKSRLQ
jgi:diguanylate cyclase (GGDEF)-like protein